MNIITFVNILLVCVFVWFMFRGYQRGFVLKLLSILSFFVLGFLAWQLSGILSQYISIYPKNAIPFAGTLVEELLYGTFNHSLLFIILFVLFQVILLVLRPALHVLDHIPVVSTLNRVAGCALGAIQGLLVLFLVALVLQLPFFEQGKQIVRESYLRYHEPFAKLALFYTKEPITQLQALQGNVDDKTSFTKEEVQKIEEWLLQQSIDKESVDAFIGHLRVE